MKVKGKYRGFIAILLIATFILSIFSGCGLVSKPVEQVKSKDSLAMLHYFSGEFSGGIDALISVFNGEQEAYVLNAIPIDHEAFKTSIIKALDENNPPELYSYWAGARTADIVDKLEPLDAIWESAELDKVFPESIVQDACKIGGNHYLLPITQHYVAFFYNKPVFERLNLAIPKDWESFLAVCEALKEEGITSIGLGSKDRWPAQFWFDYLLLRSQPIEVRRQLMEGELSYTSEAVYDAFEKWKLLIDNGYFNENPNEFEWHKMPLEGIASGEVGMTLMGTWAISVLENDYELVADKDFGFFEFPAIDDKLPLVALGPVDGIVVPRHSVNVEGAMKAIEFFSRPESQAAMAKGSGALSPSMQVGDDIYGVMQKNILPSIRRAKYWAFNYDLSTSPERAKLGLQLFSDFLVFPELYRELLAEIQREIEDQRKN